MAIHEIVVDRALTFHLQFLEVENATVLEGRPVCAVDVDDAVRQAAFGEWPAGTEFCRIAGQDGREIASVGRVRRA